MTGEQIHYRRVNTQLRVRSAGPRLLHATVLRWNTATRLSDGRTEWFNRDSAPPLRPAVLAIKHGGPRAGEVIQWRSTLIGLDAICAVDESATGDGLLELVDRWDEVPLSPAFLGSGKRHTTGVQWRALSVPELAVCAEGELPWARLRRWAP
jgi:hypothetical protein